MTHGFVIWAVDTIGPAVSNGPQSVPRGPKGYRFTLVRFFFPSSIHGLLMMTKVNNKVCQKVYRVPTDLYFFLAWVFTCLMSNNGRFAFCFFHLSCMLGRCFCILRDGRLDFTTHRAACLFKRDFCLLRASALCVQAKNVCARVWLCYSVKHFATPWKHVATKDILLSHTQ